MAGWWSSPATSKRSAMVALSWWSRERPQTASPAWCSAAREASRSWPVVVTAAASARDSAWKSMSCQRVSSRPQSKITASRFTEPDPRVARPAARNPLAVRLPGWWGPTVEPDDFDGGWDKRVTLVDGRWVDPTPRFPDREPQLRREAALLPWLGPLLPLPVPAPTVVSEDPFTVRHAYLPGSRCPG